jgi:hypothetical protein
MSKMMMTFGKYRYKTLDEVTNSGLDHEGLKYLDWCLGQAWLKKEQPDLFAAIKAYLAEPHMARSLELALEE